VDNDLKVANSKLLLVTMRCDLNGRTKKS